jgi:DNA polymerase-4
MALRYLFLDMNSYFASVEQQFRPELRNRPIAVVPVLAETTCCIAASYEAKRFGVRTGTQVRIARQLCPGLRLVEADPRLYVVTHHRFVRSIESCLPVHAVRSIDEVVCRLMGDEQRPDVALRLAGQIKTAMRRDLGEHLRCSIGLASNQFLAKVASNMQKPDGLTVLRPEDLPHRLFSLQLRDFPGIGPRMERRLHRAGIVSVQQLCQLSVLELADIWGSRWIGKVWWHQLRGDDVRETPTRRRTLSHSHVLPPALRRDADAHAILLRLLEKVAVRLRRIDYCTGSIRIAVKFLHASTWEKHTALTPRQDTPTLIRAANLLWKYKPPGAPLWVGVVLGDLAHRCNTVPSLFPEDRKLLALSQAMDRINRTCGDNAIYFAGTYDARRHAPTRIAFNHIPEIDDIELMIQR